jgi:hypothetical protein
LGNRFDNHPSLTDFCPVRLTFKETSVFTRQAAEHLSDEELNALQWALMAEPESGSLIRGSGGLRKLPGPEQTAANGAG